MVRLHIRICSALSRSNSVTPTCTFRRLTIVVVCMRAEGREEERSMLDARCSGSIEPADMLCTRPGTCYTLFFRGSEGCRSRRSVFCQVMRDDRSECDRDGVLIDHAITLGPPSPQSRKTGRPALPRASMTDQVVQRQSLDRSVKSAFTPGTQSSIGCGRR